MVLQHVDICPICDNREFSSLLDVKDSTVTGEIFHLVQCKQCELIITNPRPAQADISKYYKSEKYISHSGGTGTLFDLLYKTARTFALTRKRKLIERFHTKGDLLDFGCGTGDFLTTCQTHGWSTIGIEPSESARKKIPNSVQVHENISALTQKVDIITVWHVLEHVHDLNKTLVEFHSHLRRDGTIFIAVPNPESPDAKNYSANWAGYDVPRHLWHFNKSNMEKLLTKHGFRLQKILPMKLDAFYVSLLSESYKNQSQPALIRMFKGTWNGLLSNLEAKKDNYSSLLYIATP